MKRTGVLLIAALALALWGCSELGPTSPQRDTTMVKAEDVTGNNLSFPVLWSEGVTVSLRGTFGVTSFLGQTTLVDGVPIYHQQDPLNEWQAGSADVSGAPLAVDWIDWGDNVESKAWPYKSKVRVEVVLFQDLDAPMTGYEMVWISGLGADEMWGTTMATYDATQATVYSGCARLTIQRLTADPDLAVVAWDPALGQWTGDVTAPFYNSAVFMPGTSPMDNYSAEINVKGKVIYGMLWDTRAMGDGPGIYRLTFSLDGVNAPVPVNTFFTETTQIMVPVEEEAAKAEPVGGVTHIDVANNLTYVDLPIVESSGGGRNRPEDPGTGGGKGGRGGGGGHN